MKNILKSLCFSMVIAAVLFSCTKKENKIYYEGGTPPVLTANTGSIALNFATKDNEAVKLIWTNPNYNFTTGLSSQDVSYVLEIDTTGANFNSPNKQSLGISKDLSISLTQSVLNNYLLSLQMVPGVSHNIEFRVKSSLVNGNAILISNVLKFAITPFAIPPTIAPPSTGTLFIVGSATPGGSAHGWDNPISQSVPAQQFTKVSTTLYTITLPLIGAGEYKFIAVNGSWNDQWSIATNDDPTEIYGGPFKFNGANILAPPVSGNYKVNVDFQTGTFSVTKL